MPSQEQIEQIDQYQFDLGKPQKNNGLFLVARPLRKGGGSKGWATKKITLFAASPSQIYI